MSIGTNLRRLREEKHLTQQKLAEMMGVSFQAVSSWERDEYNPDVDKLIRLAEVFDVSLSAIISDEYNFDNSEKAIYDWQHMKSFVKTTAKNLGLTDTLKALVFAVEAHKDQIRKKSDIPYIYHPLNMACHLLAMNITDDAILSACLLHDVIEDCGKRAEDLPVSDEARTLVKLMSHEKDDSRRDEIMKQYFDRLAENPKAAMLKCVDRCNNLTTMSWGLSRERQYRMIKETRTYIIPLLKVVRAVPQYNNAAWLLQYQMESMLDIYSRMI